MGNVLDPQGVVRDIPDNLVNDAVQAGGQQVSRVQAPDKTLRWIPRDQLDAAQQAGGLVIPDMPKAAPIESSPTDKILGELGNDDLTASGRDNRPLRDRMQDVAKFSDGPGFEGSYANQDKANAMTGAGVTAGATMAGIGAAPKVIAGWEALPAAAKWVIGSQLLTQLGLSHAIGKLGDLIHGVSGQK